MMNGNGRPLSKKKAVQLMVILTLLAWATQTLFHQWGYGQEVPSTPEPASEPQERFVPGTARFAAGANLEMRSEATVVGAEVKLKQICRWSDADASIFAPIADMVLARLGQTTPYRCIAIAEVKQILRDAGVNVAAINFVGTATCTVSRSDKQLGEGEALQKWLDAQDAKLAAAEDPEPDATPDTAPTTAPSVLRAAMSQAAPIEDRPAQSLRDFLTQDLSVRLGIPREKLQVSFRPADDRVLNLAQPLFKFQVEGNRVRDLGEVSWQVTILTEGSSQRSAIQATARAWQNQLVVSKPLAFKQIIREQDVIERRTLIDHLVDDTVLEKLQAIGQQASRDLKPGQVLTARLVDAVPLVRSGQFVTVVYRQGTIELKTVARALEGGSFGQTVRVKNEATKDIFEVILTGPQTASMTSSHSPSPSPTGALASHE